jgi:hypothetical protein
MYTFSSKLKTISLILMVLGILGIGYGFLTAPKDIETVETILNNEAHAKGETHHKIDLKDAKAVAEHKVHLEHTLTQMQNKPWAALYVPMLFLMLISLGVLAFYAIQQVAQAGWSPVLFRVMQGITAYLPVASVIFFIFLLLTGLGVFHTNNLFAWMHEGITDPKSAHFDKVITGKSGYLNFPFWIIRAAIFLIGWNVYRYFSRKNCLATKRISIFQQCFWYSLL